MKIEDFVRLLDSDFYTGVPDSQLRALCDYLMAKFGTDPKHHIIAANEGNAAAIAAGYHLATGKIPVVYLQNSGEGNIINPAASLLSDQVYGIPVIFIVGWRGEPGIHDEPQHIYQGAVTLTLLEDMDIHPFVIGQDTTVGEVQDALGRMRPLLAAGKSAAFVIRKDALTFDREAAYQNSHNISREEAIRQIVRFAGADPIVSTTGKASRELFEIREQNGQGHQHDFLTVGSMGHSSSIALGLALHRPDRKIWCIDGDGAALMHLGAMTVIGTNCPDNLVHIVINNSAHESVGGMPTAAGRIDLAGVARCCGYPYTARAETIEELKRELQLMTENRRLSFLEIACSIGSRRDLGRPSTTPLENKQAFIDFIQKAGDP